jgi:hypothetical protein
MLKKCKTLKKVLLKFIEVFYNNKCGTYILYVGPF